VKQFVTALVFALAAQVAVAQEAAPVVEVAPAAPQFPVVVQEIRIEGLQTTHRYVFLRELPWKEGELVTQELWQRGIDRLWLTDLFGQIDAQVIDDNGQKVAKFVVEERFTLNPLLKYAIAGLDTWWFRIGLSDPNLLGHFIEWGAQYERFGKYNGGQAWLKNPRLFDRRLTGLFQGERLARPRPGFVVFRSMARLEVSGEVHDYLAFSGRTDLISDDFDQPVAGTPNLPTKSWGVLVSAGMRAGRVEIQRLQQRNWAFEVRPLVGLTTDPQNPRYLQLWTQFLGFVPFTPLLTGALRVQGGAMTQAPPQHRFYFGGLDFVRGLPDNDVRTLAYAIMNAEIRWVVFDSTWIALVPTAWVDTAVAAPESGSTPLWRASTGVGCRFLIPKLVATGLRLDFAIPLDRPMSKDWFDHVSLGVFQFF